MNTPTKCCDHDCNQGRDCPNRRVLVRDRFVPLATQSEIDDSISRSVWARRHNDNPGVMMPAMWVFAGLVCFALAVALSLWVLP